MCSPYNNNCDTGTLRLFGSLSLYPGYLVNIFAISTSIYIFLHLAVLFICLFSSHLGLNPHIFMQAISVVSHLRRTCGWAYRTEQVHLTQMQQIAMAQTLCKPMFNNKLSIYLSYFSLQSLGEGLFCTTDQNSLTS